MSSTLRRTALQVLKKQKFSTAPSSVRKNTEPNLLTSVFKDLPVTNYTINDFVWQNLDKWPDKTATVCAVTGHGYTYAQTHKMSVTLAASLRNKLKLRNDDKVAVILPSIPEYPVTVLGILQAGCVASMMNPVYTTNELKRQLELVECKAIFTSKISYANVKGALSAMKVDIPVILVENENLPEGTIKFAELAEDFYIDTDCLKSVHRSPNDVGILPFSSGTTGFPKAVVLSHKSVVAMNQMISDPAIVAIKETTATYQAVLPAILPFFHIFGFNSLMMNQLMLGVKLVTMPYFKPDFFLQTIVNYKADILFIVPPMVVFLGKHPAVKAEHLASVSGIISGAAPLSASDADAVLNKNEGEIWCRGPHLMSGYYKNDEATNEVLVEGGWYKTGDIGKYDENKYLYVTDRLKELIKVKGFQVPPAELETVLRTHPKVLDCAVLGIPHPITGEVPKAFVVPQPGEEIDPMEILEYVNNQVSSFKNIKEVQFVDVIPKNPAGKILRKDLKEKYC